MSTLLNFFVSFDKLMKERLVKAFYWLALIVIILHFGETILRTIPFIGWFFAAIIDFIGFFPQFALAIVGLRLLCEYLIATFRINDNLSPDGGKGETADVDIIDEARKAAEVAASKAKDAAKTATEKTKTAMEKTKTATEGLSEKVQKTTENVATKAKVKKTVDPEDVTIEPPVKVKRAPRKTAAKKTAAKKPATKKAATTKKTASKKPAAKKTTAKKPAAKKPPTKKG